MARKQVVQIACDRCSRVEHRADAPVSLDQPMLTLNFMGQEYTYKDLCCGCEETIRSLIETNMRNLKKSSPIHEKTRQKYGLKKYEPKNPRGPRIKPEPEIEAKTPVPTKPIVDLPLRKLGRG